MNRAERIYRLHQLLSGRCPVSLERLRDQLGEASRATVNREIAYLRNFFGAPVVYDREHNGYQYDPDAPAFELPGLFFNESELFALLASERILESVQPAVVEFFNHGSIQCLLHSVPISELFKNVKIKYRKIEVQKNGRLLKQYKIKRLPSLVFFKNGGIAGKVEGYYGVGDKKELAEKVNRIISKIKKIN